MSKVNIVSARRRSYNENMRILRLHEWNVTAAQAITLQRDLSSKVLRHDGVMNPRWIAGLDVSVNIYGEARAAAVVLNFPELKVCETSVANGKAEFPYIPGLLSFREVPLTLRACEKLTLQPDLVLVDGQGIAHPRSMGLASHLGLFLDIPTIGCAKSPLYGTFREPAESTGSFSDINNPEGEVIGAVLRTKTGVKPLFISIGHKIDLSSSISWVLKCCRGYRLPEPTRLAHLTSKGCI